MIDYTIREAREEEMMNSTLIIIILGYILLMNILGYLTMWLDKRKAKRGEYRISEKTLFMVAILGGSIGSIAGMKKFRHKTKHWYFKYGMPAILILQIIVVFLLNLMYTKS